MSISGDMLKGAAKIAAFTGFDEREIYRCHETGALPTFNVGKHICARKSELDRRLSSGGGRAKDTARLDRNAGTPTPGASEATPAERLEEDEEK